MRKYNALSLIALFIIAITLVFSSCTPYKDIPYFTNISDNARDSLVTTAEFKDPVINPDDILAVNIITIDPTTATAINQSSSQMISTQFNGAPTMVAGLLVDKNGEITEPIIGKIKVAGLTTSEARDLIREKTAHYYKDPDVQVRFANFTITVLGEVTKPSSFTVPSEKVSILDAIGMAGDLTIYGMRENVLVIREVDGKKVVNRLNLNSAAIFKSPFFYLRQNNVVYVQPNKQKAIAADASRTRTLTVAASVAAVLVVLLTRIK